MIYTSSYTNIKLDDFKENHISISADRGRTAKIDGDKPYDGPCYIELAPKKDFWRTWKDNKKAGCDEEKNNKYYIREYYKQVLKELDVDKVYNDLDGKILLCYEDSNDFCHRQIVASWFELYLGEIVPEIKQKGIKVVETTNRDYIKEYLEKIIKEDVDMKGFNSLNALHLYEKSERLEKVAKNNNDLDISRYLRELAYEKENEYLNNQKVKLK